MRKCKGCNECSGMCRETWNPLEDDSGSLMEFIIVILAIAGIVVLILP